MEQSAKIDPQNPQHPQYNPQQQQQQPQMTAAGIDQQAVMNILGNFSKTNWIDFVFPGKFSKT